jgi:hypothetical protein
LKNFFDVHIPAGDLCFDQLWFRTKTRSIYTIACR